MNAARDKLSQAYTDLGLEGWDQQQFQMQGLDKAENYYKPAQDRLDALYGPPGAFKK